MFRLEVHGHCCVAADRIYENTARTFDLGLPVIEGWPTSHHGPLAVVGGGPSAARYLDELREWGAVWAINGTHGFLRSQGIESALFSVDPSEELSGLTQGVNRAILSSHCDPLVFEALEGAAVSVFHSEYVKGAKSPMVGGSTSATRAPMVALMMGYRPVSFFGCEGSFTNTTHTFKDESADNQLVVRAGGVDYRTSLQFMVQSENLAALIRGMPGILLDRSGGLLSAMIEHWETWEVVALSQALRDTLDPTAFVPYEIRGFDV